MQSRAKRSTSTLTRFGRLAGTKKTSPLPLLLSKGRAWKFQCVAVAIKLVEKSSARPQLRGRYLGANYRHLLTFEKQGEIGGPDKRMETGRMTGWMVSESETPADKDPGLQ